MVDVAFLLSLTIAVCCNGSRVFLLLLSMLVGEIDEQQSQVCGTIKTDEPRACANEVAVAFTILVLVFVYRHRHSTFRCFTSVAILCVLRFDFRVNTYTTSRLRVNCLCLFLLIVVDKYERFTSMFS